MFAVLDDEDSNNITAGSIVTVTVTLTRKRMAVSIQQITGPGNVTVSPVTASVCCSTVLYEYLCVCVCRRYLKKNRSQHRVSQRNPQQKKRYE